jgi:hypothetical protein
LYLLLVLALILEQGGNLHAAISGKEVNHLDEISWSNMRFENAGHACPRLGILLLNAARALGRAQRLLGEKTVAKHFVGLFKINSS